MRKLRHKSALWETAAFLEAEAYQQLELALADSEAQDLLDTIVSVPR